MKHELRTSIMCYFWGKRTDRDAGRVADGLTAFLLKNYDVTPINERVKRWDVYDIADELADVPSMVDAGWREYALAVIKDLEQRLWAAAERGGNVGPYPGYEAR